MMAVMLLMVGMTPTMHRVRDETYTSEDRDDDHKDVDLTTTKTADTLQATNLDDDDSTDDTSGQLEEMKEIDHTAGHGHGQERDVDVLLTTMNALILGDVRGQLGQL